MNGKQSGIVSSFILPRLPGHSGGEIRDFYILRKLANLLNIKLISMTDTIPDGREDALCRLMETCYEPRLLKSEFPDLVDRKATRRNPFTRSIGLLRKLNIPVWGARYHRDISLVTWQVDAYVLPVLRHLMRLHSPDFIFVTPQLNPTLLRLNTNLSKTTRTVLLSYDVETIRLERLADAEKGLARAAKKLESRRAEQYERENLRNFDGVVVVSELDKLSLVNRFKLDPERILTIENSVDEEYFSFDKPVENSGTPTIVFVGNLAYWPNQDASIRLFRSIVPLIQKEVPSARALVAGDKPGRDLITLSDGKLGQVVGPVEDIRQFLHQASIVCIPLRAGSGTKYKVLEALGTGRPVVCTSIAAEGLDIRPGEHYVAADSDEEIANACIKVIRNPEMYGDMILRARKLIENRYSWGKNLTKLEPWLEKIRQADPVKSI